MLYLLLLLFQDPQISFSDVTQAAGLIHEHGFDDIAPSEPRKFSGGVAAGDVNGDGHVDLFFVGGDKPNHFYKNNGDGTFTDKTAEAGLALEGLFGCGPVFADYDGDGHLDLFIGGLEGTGPRLMRNNGDGTFSDQTEASGLSSQKDTISAAFGDMDGDGDLDLFLTHWTMTASGEDMPEGCHLWRNDAGVFTCVDLMAGIFAYDYEDFSFTPNFADIDNDGDLDILVAGDFLTSKVFRNQGLGMFVEDSAQILTDQNGMGAAVGDYDNDGDLDWFITSIFNPTPDTEPRANGNRFYQNDGTGLMKDVSETAGVRDGSWGWGASFGDFNNDGWQDLVHLNGWFGPIADQFEDISARLFLASGQGWFLERSRQTNLVDRGQGRGLVVFDYDRDGDLDLLTANSFGSPALHRNDGGNQGNWLEVNLRQNGANAQASGARIYLETEDIRQMRELRVGNNYVSQNPTQAFFGVPEGKASLEVRWPDGLQEQWHSVEPNQALTLHRQAPHSIYLPISSIGSALVTEITLIQPEGGTADLIAYGYNGEVLRRWLPAVPVGGKRRIDIWDLWIDLMWVRIDSDKPIYAYMEGQDLDGAFATPGVRSLSSELVIPHIAQDTAQFFTFATMVNVTGGSTPPVLSVGDKQFSYTPIQNQNTGVLVDLGNVLVGETPPPSALMRSDQAGLTGVEVFGFKTGGSIAGLTLEPETSKHLIYAHIASVENGWWTGLVALNPGSEIANLTVTIWSAAGSSLGQQLLQLQPGEKVTTLIDPNISAGGLFPEGLPEGAAWIEVTSDQNISGYELFGNLNGGLFAGIQAGTAFTNKLIMPNTGDANHFAAVAVISEQAQQISIKAMDQEGKEIAVLQRDLSAKERFIFVLSELIENIPDDGYLVIEGSAGMHGFLLYGPNNGRWLAGLNGLTL